MYLAIEGGKHCFIHKYNKSSRFNIRYSPFLPAPSAPVQLSVVSLSSTAISVSWATSSSPNGIISHYIVTSFPTLSGRGNASTFNASALQFNISDLTPFTNYTIFVAAVTVDVGNESDLATVVTDEAGMYIMFYL